MFRKIICLITQYLLAWIPTTTSGKHQETLNIWIKPFLLWSMLGTSCFGYWFHWQGMERAKESRREILEESLLQNAHSLRQEEHKRTEAPSQGDAGVASSSSVLEWPSQGLNFKPGTNCRVSWWSQLTNNPLQVWQNLRGSQRKYLLKLKCSTILVESRRLEASENTDCIVFQLNFLYLLLE